MQNFYHDTITPLRPQICENAHQVTQLLFWFFLPPAAKIITINTSNDVVSHKNVPFGGRDNKILHLDPIYPPKRKLAIFDGT